MPLTRSYTGVGVVAAVLLLTGGVLGYFLFVERAREYFHTEFYQDTGLTPMAGAVGMWAYASDTGHVTLVLSRGKPHSTVSTAHGWSEVVSLEWPARPAVGSLDLASGKVRVGFYAFWGRDSWVIGEGGVRGSIDIESITEDRIVARYDLMIDTFNQSLAAGHQHRAVGFSGRSVFERKPRPTDRRFAASGPLYPQQWHP